MVTQHSSGCRHLCKGLSCGLPEMLSLRTELGRWGRRCTDFRGAFVLDTTTQPCMLPSWAPPRVSCLGLPPSHVSKIEKRKKMMQVSTKVGNHFRLSLKGFPLMLSCYKAVKRHIRIVSIHICFCCHFKYILGAHCSNRKVRETLHLYLKIRFY